MTFNMILARLAVVPAAAGMLLVGTLRAQDALTAVPADQAGPEACCILFDFDDLAPGECMNDKYAHLGVRFDRDDGACVLVVDWEARGYVTSTPPNVLGTFAGPGAPEASSHLWIRFDRRAFGAHACVGNDRTPARLQIESWWEQPGFSTYSSDTRATNGNTHVDELRLSNGSGRTRLTYLDEPYAIAIDSLLVNLCGAVRKCLFSKEGRPEENRCTPVPLL